MDRRNCGTDSIPKGLKQLERMRIIRKNTNDFNFKRVFHLMLDKELYYIMLEKIRKNKGYGTPGMDKEIPDGMSVNLIKEIIEELKSGVYQPRPLKRIYIPKKNGTLRPLSLPTLRDKLVQGVMKLVLEAVYEDTFHSCSHGFRKGKRCHSALKDVRVMFAGVK